MNKNSFFQSTKNKADYFENHFILGTKSKLPSSLLRGAPHFSSALARGERGGFFSRGAHLVRMRTQCASRLPYGFSFASRLPRI